MIEVFLRFPASPIRTNAEVWMEGTMLTNVLAVDVSNVVTISFDLGPREDRQDMYLTLEVPLYKVELATIGLNDPMPSEKAEWDHANGRGVNV